ncbi:MAG: hypothetical protein ABJA66_00295 [Actinomycetota bacterium]
MHRKENMPDLVYIGLLGINSKATAYVYLAIAAFVGLSSIYMGFSKPTYLWSVLMFLASLWYYYCMNWVDNNSNWDN